MPVNDGDARLLNIVTNATFADIAANTSLPPTNYVFKENITISSNVVVSDKLTFEPQDGAMFVKSGSGTITFSGIGIAAEDISPYAQIFSGFAPGDVKWGDQMPSGIYATWFGAKSGSSTYAAANSAAAKVIQTAFTKETAQGLNAGIAATNYFGSIVKYPSGDFYFSEPMALSHAYAVEGVANNYHWGQATRFLFPQMGDGVHITKEKRELEKGRSSGFSFKNVAIGFYGSAPASVAVGLGNNRVTAAAGILTFPEIDRGVTFTLPVSGFPVEIDDPYNPRLLDVKADDAILSNLTDGKYTRLALPGLHDHINGNAPVVFTSANVGDTIMIPFDVARTHSPGLIARITGYVGPTTVDITPVGPFERVNNTNATSVGGAVYVHAVKGTSMPIQPVRIKLTLTGGSQTIPANLDACFLNSTFSLPGTSFSATIDSIGSNSFHITAPIPTDYAGLQTVQFAGLSTSGTINVKLNKRAGLRATFSEHAVIENVRVDGQCEGGLYQGSGFVLNSIVTPFGNVDHTTLRYCKAEWNNGHGFHFIGTDCHETHLEDFNSVHNNGYGIYDFTGTGMKHSQGHMSANYGSVKCVGLVNQSVFDDIYTEAGGYLGAMLPPHAMWRGGSNGLGFQPDSLGAFVLSTYWMRSGWESQVHGARFQGIGLVNADMLNKYQSRIWGDLSSSAPILSGAAAARNAGTLNNPGVTADWSLYHSPEGFDIGTGYQKATGFYGAGFNVDRKSWHTRLLEVGDNTNDAKTAGHFIAVFARTAEPSGGSYPKGSICYNINHDGTNVSYWVNTVDNGSTWVAVTPGSGSTAYSFTDNFNRSDGAVGNGWTVHTTGFYSAKSATIASNKLTFPHSGYGAIRRLAEYTNTRQEITISATPNEGGVSLLARMQNESNCYSGSYENSTSYSKIYKQESGGRTPISSANLTRTPQAGDVMRFTVNGQNLKLEILNNGLVVDSITATDSTFSSSTYVGIADEYAGWTVDDYKLYQL
jgi:hypothetical protein